MHHGACLGLIGSAGHRVHIILGNGEHKLIIVLGRKLLYPVRWKVSSCHETVASESYIFRMPGGGFLID